MLVWLPEQHHKPCSYTPSKMFTFLKGFLMTVTTATVDYINLILLIRAAVYVVIISCERRKNCCRIILVSESVNTSKDEVRRIVK